MSVNIRPLADRVLVEPAAAEQTTASGIIIPDSAKEKPQKGTVVAVGPGKKDDPTTVQGRHRALREVLRHGTPTRRHRLHDHARIGHPRDPLIPKQPN